MSLSTNEILNLGCGPKQIPWATNVDIQALPNVDYIHDLTEFPWPWEDKSIVGIYMFHLLEHFPDPRPVLLECHRILRHGGFLHIKVPHASCISSVGCIGHFRTYSYNTLKEYLSRPYYMFGDPLFKTTHQKLNWWYEEGSDVNVPGWMQPMLTCADKVINKAISLSPQVFENLWWPLVGGAREVVWRGVKI